MGLIRGSSETAQHLDEAIAADFPPFSHDRHFSARSAYGYRAHAIEKIIVIGGAGQIVGVEEPSSPVGSGRRKGALLVPAINVCADDTSLRFLWGPARSVFGLSGTRPGARHDRRAEEDHLKYKALHRHALESVGDIALQAFLRFLETQSVNDAAMLVGRSHCKLAFRFQYDEHYLHERHAAQLAWRRLLAQSVQH